MKRLIAVLALALSGCATAEGKLGLFQKGPAAPTVDQVKVFLRADAVKGEENAERFLIKRGVPDADVMLLIAQAKDSLEREKARCLGLESCGS